MSTIFRVFVFIIISSMCSMGYSNTSQDINFNYQIIKVSSVAKLPEVVFSSEGKTYIKYPNIYSRSELPSLYLLSDASWKWKYPYIIINKVISKAKVVDNKTGTLIYSIVYNDNYTPWISKAQKVHSKAISGYFIAINTGIGGLNNKIFTSPVFMAAIGYDSAVTEKLLLGMELQYSYNGISKEDIQINAGSARFKSSDISILGRIIYLFDNGVSVFSSGGLAYLHSSMIGKNEDNVLVPRFNLGSGYNFCNGYGLTLTYSHLFESKKTVNANALTVGIQYHF
jgi:hypothetical protein